MAFMPAFYLLRDERQRVDPSPPPEKGGGRRLKVAGWGPARHSFTRPLPNALCGSTLPFQGGSEVKPLARTARDLNQGRARATLQPCRYFRSSPPPCSPSNRRRIRPRGG